MGRPRWFKGKAPIVDRTPRVAAAPPTDRNPVWRVGKIDTECPWCFHDIDGSELKKVAEKLKSFETMTWPDIERGGSHLVSVDQLIPAAQRRLQELRLDDFDELFSLRLGGKPRIWGTKNNNVFSALWWDPEHVICPVERRHT
jgi:hypothetical protein